MRSKCSKKFVQNLLRSENQQSLLYTVIVMSSIVEWCEAKVDRYNYSWVLSEYWNSISNIFFLLSMSTHHSTYVNISIAMVGIGSFVFHATESNLGQLMDEISMTVLAYMYCIKVCPSVFPSIGYNVLFVCVWTIYIYYKIYIVFVLFFAIQITIPVYIVCVHRTKTPQQKYYLGRAATYVAFSCICWIWERYLYFNNQCPTELFDPRYYLHSYWHFGMANAHYNFMNSIS